MKISNEQLTKKQIQNQKWNNSEKGRASIKKWRESPKGIAYIAAHEQQALDAMIARNRAQRKDIRQEVIKLYTKGACCCDTCKSTDDLEIHHTDPRHGLIEKKTWTTNTCVEARRHQLSQHEKNPLFVVVLCMSCHKSLHTIMRRKKHTKKETN